MTQPIGTPDWGTHTQLIRENVVSFNTSIKVGPGASQSITVGLTKLGYAVFLSLYDFSGGSTPMAVEIVVQWIDSALPPEFGRQRWWVFAGTSAGIHAIEGHGPAETGTMKITITNHHALDTLDFTLDVADVSQPYTGHDWRSVDWTQTIVPGLPIADGDIDAGYIALMTSTAVGAGTDVQYVCPLYSGPTVFSVSCAPTVGMNIQMVNAADATLANPGIMAMIPMNPSFAGTVDLMLPRAQCAIQFNNYSTSATSGWASLVADRR